HAAARLAQGRADRAIRFASEEEGIHEALLRIDAGLVRRDLGAIVDLAQTLAQKKEYRFVLEMLQMFYRDVCSAASGMDDAFLTFDRIAPKIRARAERMSANAASQAVAFIHETLDSLEGNANLEIALDALFARLAKMMH